MRKIYICLLESLNTFPWPKETFTAIFFIPSRFYDYFIMFTSNVVNGNYYTQISTVTSKD